jgi:hypothetical protein
VGRSKSSKHLLSFNKKESAQCLWFWLPDMKIHDVYRFFSRHFRPRRMQMFYDHFQISKESCHCCQTSGHGYFLNRLHKLIHQVLWQYHRGSKLPITGLVRYTVSIGIGCAIAPPLHDKVSAVVKFLDAMIIVITGYNETTLFTEWTTYPLLPQDFGMNFTSRMNVLDTQALHFVVEINKVNYDCEITIGST